MSAVTPDLAEAAAGLLAAARGAGADKADAVLGAGVAIGLALRHGALEHLERAESRELGLRVFVGRRSAIVSAGAIEARTFARLAEQAVAMARAVPEDRFADIPEAPPAPALDLDLADEGEPVLDILRARARAAEDAARSVRGITNTEGAEAGYSRGTTLLATSRGFIGQHTRSSHSVSVTAIAGEGTGMQRDYDYSTAVHAADLDDPAALGRQAAQRAVARLNPARPKTARLPVIFHPRAAASLLGHLAGAINGAAIARGTSFLKDAMGTALFAPAVAIIDDPLRPRGPRSRAFDGEGQAVGRRALIEGGVLATWLLDQRSAAQLGLPLTGHATRGTQGPPSAGPSNLYLDRGPLTPEALLAETKEALYVTELIGSGVNGLTGDYSRGAAGFMVRGGVMAEPVAEITIAGTLREMFASLTPANDLDFRRGMDSPTVRVGPMTLAGA